MSDALSRTASREAADASVASFRQVLGAVLALEGLLALVLLIWPGSILPEPSAGTRLIGALLAWTALFQIPGQRSPVHGRTFVMLGMAGRAVVGLVCVLGGGSLLVAGVLALAADLALLLMFHGMVAAVLMSRP